MDGADFNKFSFSISICNSSIESEESLIGGRHPRNEFDARIRGAIWSPNSRRADEWRRPESACCSFHPGREFTAHLPAAASEEGRIGHAEASELGQQREFGGIANSVSKSRSR
jgi:hypothetical protein